MKKLPYGLRKYLRREKARIRKAIKDAGEAQKALQVLFEKVRR